MEGFLICKNCGLVVDNYIFSSDFIPAGFLSPKQENKIFKIVNKEYEKNPEINNNDLIAIIKNELNIIDYLK